MSLQKVLATSDWIHWGWTLRSYYPCPGGCFLVHLRICQVRRARVADCRTKEIRESAQGILMQHYTMYQGICKNSIPTGKHTQMFTPHPQTTKTTLRNISCRIGLVSSELVSICSSAISLSQLLQTIRNKPNPPARACRTRRPPDLPPKFLAPMEGPSGPHGPPWCWDPNGPPLGPQGPWEKR